MKMYEVFDLGNGNSTHFSSKKDAFRMVRQSSRQDLLVVYEWAEFGETGPGVMRRIAVPKEDRMRRRLLLWWLVVLLLFVVVAITWVVRFTA